MWQGILCRGPPGLPQLGDRAGPMKTLPTEAALAIAANDEVRRDEGSERESCSGNARDSDSGLRIEINSLG